MSGPDGVHTHCWHASHVQHTISNHECQVCCHCGEKRCIMPKGQERWKGHGRYHPEAPFTVHPGERFTIIGNDIHAGDTE